MINKLWILSLLTISAIATSSKQSKIMELCGVIFVYTVTSLSQNLDSPEGGHVFSLSP